MSYDKKALTTKEHIDLLKKRGLTIDDDATAAHYLKTLATTD